MSVVNFTTSCVETLLNGHAQTSTVLLVSLWSLHCLLQCKVTKHIVVGCWVDTREQENILIEKGVSCGAHEPLFKINLLAVCSIVNFWTKLMIAS